MKKTIFLACAALVVSAAAVVGIKAYNRSQMSDLALANIEALSRGENNNILRVNCKLQEYERCCYDCDVCDGVHTTEYYDYIITEAYGYCTGVRIYEQF